MLIIFLFIESKINFLYLKRVFYKMWWCIYLFIFTHVYIYIVFLYKNIKIIIFIHIFAISIKNSIYFISLFLFSSLIFFISHFSIINYAKLGIYF